MVVAIFTLIGLLWLALGLAMIAMPGRWSAWVQQSFAFPSSRFLIAQAVLLIGLVLVLGTSGFQSYWLWVTLGVLGVLKSLFFLAVSQDLCNRILAWFGRLPSWVFRLEGLALVALSTWLGIDTVRGLL